MRKLILLVSFLIAIKSFAQTSFISEAGTTGDEELYNVVQSADGNFFAAGFSNSNDADGDTYLAKLNSSGQQLWSKIASTSVYDEGFGIINTTDGGFAVSGSTGNKMGILKFDASANLSWSKQYNELTASDGSRMLQTSDGGYLFPGGISSDNFNTAQSYLIKTDASGNVQWSKKYFNVDYSFIYDVKKTADNNYVFLAINYSNIDSDSAYIVKINSSGSVIWCKYFYSSTEYVDGFALNATSDGGYVITGETYASAENGFILKIDGNGNYKWSKSTNVGFDEGTIFFDAVETSDGGYVAAGQYYNIDSAYFYFTKFNSTGNVVWTKRLSYSDGYNIVYKIIKTSDGGYLSAGSTGSSIQAQNGFIIKFDANFNSCRPMVNIGNIITFGNLATGNAPTYNGNTTVTNTAVSVTNAGSVTNKCNALPLTLLSFNGSMQNKVVNLQWKTSQEINTSYFDIEKSIDAKVFTSFARVTAAGNSNVIKSYATSDNNPSKGENWYRLKMVDKDGVFAYSNQVKVNNNSNGSVYLYPNPALGHAALYFNSNNICNYVLKITDMSGKTLQTLTGKFIPGDNIIHLDAASLARGLYLVSVVAEGQPKVVLKLNKQ
jgi:hypothetical protein